MIDLVTTGVMPEYTHMIATKAQYHALRESIGSQKEVAKMLGVDIRTVQRRESGEIMITFEATRALYSLAAINSLHTLIGKCKSNGIRHELDNIVARLEVHEVR
jgi:transcriptional regulator with XRE-family HTH domain